MGIKDLEEAGAPRSTPAQPHSARLSDVMAYPTDSGREGNPLPGLLTRPVQSLHGLPPRERWEVTRRHPYYLVFWESARAHYDRTAVEPLRVHLVRVATEILLSIGVTGPPPPPTASAEEIAVDQIAGAWRDGAIAPVTYRGLAGVLANLPRQSRMALGAKLVMSGKPVDPTAKADDDEICRLELARELMTVQDPALDVVPPRPIVGINLYAPQKAIRGAVERLVRDLKRREGIPERRRWHGKVAQYLRVWDLREGWADGRYDPGLEMPFARIAATVRAPLATVTNRYASAFALISGHRHSFAAWAKLFTVLKLFGPYGVACLRRRHVNGASRRAGRIRLVSEADLAGEGDSRHGLLESLAASLDSEVHQTLSDIQALIRRGRDDQQIIAALEPANPEAMRQVVQYLRRRAAGVQVADRKENTHKPRPPGT